MKGSAVMRMRLRVPIALAMAMILSASMSCSRESGSSPKSAAKNEPALVPGRVICKDPVWIGVEGGKEGKIHLNATDEQVAKLRSKWTSIALCPPGIIRGRHYSYEFDLVDPKQERPVTYTMIRAGGEPFRDTDLFPVAIIGIAADESETKLAVATPYRRPIWEELPTRFFDIQFSRYPAHAAAGMPRLPGSKVEQDRLCAAITVSARDEKRELLSELYASIEIRVSLLPDAIVVDTQDLREGVVTQLLSGEPLSEDADVSLISITGVRRGGDREPLHLPKK